MIERLPEAGEDTRERGLMVLAGGPGEHKGRGRLGF
jgi:hypothetical protein